MFIHPDFTKSPFIKEYESVLDFLYCERVCSFKIENNEIIIEEECDNCFRVNLTKEMMEQFISELQELTNQLQ